MVAAAEKPYAQRHATNARKMLHKKNKGLPVWVTEEVNKVDLGDLPEEDVKVTLMLAERALQVVENMAESGENEDQWQEAQWKLMTRIVKLGRRE